MKKRKLIKIKRIRKKINTKIMYIIVFFPLRLSLKSP